MHKLSIVIITKNEESNISRCLESVKKIADEIIVVDDFSNDKTVELCTSYGCRVILRKFHDFSDQKQFAVDQSVNDWVFSIDADEELTEKMQNEIKQLFSNEVIPCVAYKTPRLLFYMGHRMRLSGVGEKPVLRIFNKNHIEFSASKCNRGEYKHTRGTPLRITKCLHKQIISAGLMN